MGPPFCAPRALSPAWGGAQRGGGRREAHEAKRGSGERFGYARHSSRATHAAFARRGPRAPHLERSAATSAQCGLAVSQHDEAACARTVIIYELVANREGDVLRCRRDGSGNTHRR